MKKILFGILFSTIFVLVFSQEPEKTNSVQIGVGLSPLITSPKYGIVGEEISIKLISGLTVNRLR